MHQGPCRGPVFDGLAWIPDGSGLVFGSAKGSTILYPPTFQLRLVRLAGGDSEQLTFGAESYTDPDVNAESGLLLATWTRLRSALSKVPTTDAPTANRKARSRSRTRRARCKRRRRARMASASSISRIAGAMATSGALTPTGAGESRSRRYAIPGLDWRARVVARWQPDRQRQTERGSAQRTMAAQLGQVW